jgi:Na+/proline symporter
LAAALAQAPQTYRDGFGGMVGFTALGFVVGLMATGFGALGQPHLTAWIMAARDRRARVTGAAVAILWGGGVYLGMAVLGLSGRAIFGADMAAEGVFFALADQVLPAAAGGLIAAAMLSAIMSTVDSQLLVAGAAMSHDLGLKRWLGGREVLASRVAILALSVLAVALTLFLPSTIFERTLFAWTALGAAFGPTVIARALGIRAGGVSVLISILAGFAACLAFELGVEAGPADVWARTLPWLLAGMPLVLGARIGARWTSQARLS